MNGTECKKEKLEELMNKCDTLAGWVEPYLRDENYSEAKGKLIARYLGELGRHYDAALEMYQDQVLLCRECNTPCEAGFEERIKEIEKKMNELNKSWEEKANA